MKTKKQTMSSKTNSRRPTTRAARSRPAVKETVIASAKKASSVTSINNGIDLVRFALENKISVSAAAKTKGFGRNYISDIKARLEDNLKNNNITKTQYKTFNGLSNRYDKSSSK